MKDILLIGMGRFGHHLCKDLYELGNQIMIVDSNEENVKDLLSYATNAVIGDCTKPEVLAGLGVRNFDIVFVCIGTNFQSALEITSQVKELGAKYVVSKVTRDIQAKFLLRNGADEVIYPDRDVAEKAALKYGTDNVFDNLELTEEYSIYEIPVLKEWQGRSIADVDVRAKYHINILGIKEKEDLELMPKASLVLNEDMHLMVIGRKEDLLALLR